MQTNDLKARKNIFVHSFPARPVQNKVYNPRFIKSSVPKIQFTGRGKARRV